MHHQVKKGDNLFKIARQYGITVIIILQKNPHLRKRPHHIRVGERIRVR
ncbi:MAG: LysM peptidoglycan-binding domain-containing protein [Peptococcaceae bacterium]|nr:LysM peptidoglycan-binding domain-containing protein [Peptococcaceae bacterium]